MVPVGKKVTIAGHVQTRSTEQSRHCNHSPQISTYFFNLFYSTPLTRSGGAHRSGLTLIYIEASQLCTCSAIVFFLPPNALAQLGNAHSLPYFKFHMLNISLILCSDQVYGEYTLLTRYVTAQTWLEEHTLQALLLL